jgi:hypothetical protein
MPLSLGSAGKTFAPASAATRSVVTPESARTALESFPPVRDTITIQASSPAPLAAPNVLFGSSHRASGRAFNGGGG